MDGKKPRSSNIELLRILAMLMIIGHHLSIHSNLVFPTDTVTANRFFLHWLDWGGKVGLDIFVLISGYFLITSKGFRLSKVLKLWGQVLFYALGLKLLCPLLGIGHPEHMSLSQALLPLSSGQWWFATSYFVLFLLSPFLSVGLNALTKQQYRGLLAVMTVIWCLLPTLLRRSVESSNLIWFVYLYALAGYLRLYPEDVRLKTGWHFAIAVAFLAANLAWATLCDVIGTRHPGIEVFATGFFGMDQLPVLIASVALFLGFLGLKLHYSRWINALGGACFGVYLLHDSTVMRYYLWNELLPVREWAQSPWLIPMSLAVIAAVFTVCAAIDLLRTATAERLWMQLISRIGEKTAP